ncbi:hypothetical protein [Streptomyces sp. cmx-4-9]|uniref:hypothetical protein n=1 Tax=Streptomyces sp. cmx-4-9 TaxID=2790941 RepID=UPI00397FF224
MAMETVVSPLLTDPPAAPSRKALPVDPDFAATAAAGYVETLEEFGARMTVGRLAALNAGAALFFAALALTGRHYLRRTR